MSHTRDFLEQNEDRFNEWVIRYKNAEIAKYPSIDEYITANYDELVREFIDTFPEPDVDAEKEKWADYNDDIKSGLTNNL